MSHFKSLLVKLGVALAFIGFPVLSYGANMIEGIGEYHLGQDIKTVRGLVEFTPEEYAAIWSSQGGVGLPSEQIFNAPEVSFNRHLWYLVVGALNGRIYKLALQYVTGDRAEARRIFQDTLKFVKSRMGAPAEQTKTPERYLWRSTDGNVVLAGREAMGSWGINLLLTAQFVK